MIRFSIKDILLVLFCFTGLCFSYSTSQIGFLQLQIKVMKPYFQKAQLFDFIQKQYDDIINIGKYLASSDDDCQNYARVTNSQIKQLKNPQNPSTKHSIKIIEKTIVYDICSINTLESIIKQLQKKEVEDFQGLIWKKDTKNKTEQITVYSIRQVKLDAFHLNKFERVSQLINFVTEEAKVRKDKIDELNQNKQSTQATSLLITYDQMLQSMQLESFAKKLKTLYQALHNEQSDIHFYKQYKSKGLTNYLYMAPNIKHTKTVANQKLTLAVVQITVNIKAEQWNKGNKNNKSCVEAVFVKQQDDKQEKSQRIVIISDFKGKEFIQKEYFQMMNNYQDS